ncbi:diguanylate cyclase domain-containing protein, partial [Eggerthella lenta]|uniref:diguanylate cyclase domain-containing protein n=1 Tax=Eggerthella lenta TaxID=84112 RepID=UPI00210B8B40|nr:diguanylate cyclase [Eggerthella lenta]
MRVRALIDAHPDEAYVLVYGDIDRFKAYNDLFGTSAGDSLLADIGAQPSRRRIARQIAADHLADI